MIRLTPLLAAAVILFGLAAAPAHAQIYVDVSNSSGTQDGTSWSTAYADLQTALGTATGSDEIWVAQGVYTPDNEGDSFTITGNIDGVQVYGGFDGTETSRSGRDPGAHPTILSGDLNGDDTDPDGDGIIEDADPNQDGTPENLNGGENAHHVLVLDGGNGIGSDVSADVTSATVIDGVVVTAGHADGGSFPDNAGGGLYCDGRSTDNECSPTLQGVVFAGNAASDNGGAIHNDGYNEGTSSPVVTSATFTGNAASSGGAIYNDGDNTGGTSPVITNATFEGNAVNFQGGAIYNDGGAEGTSSPQITNVTFANNAADEGGAIYNNGRTLGSASPQITNATFTGNAASRGGAMYNDGSDRGTASPQVNNTILWGNGASTVDEIYNLFTTNDPPVLSHTIIQGGVPSSATDGGGNLDQDPQLADPSSPAGLDGAFATPDDGPNVSDSSPALDAGDNASLPSGVTEDITGADRTQDRDGDNTATVNIGAYEDPFPDSPVATTGSVSNLGSTTANLSGTVDPNNRPATVRAELFPTSAPSDVRTETASASPLNGSHGQSVTISLTGLTPNTEYRARMLANNLKGGDQGTYVRFTTGAGYSRTIFGQDDTGNDAGWRMLALPAADKTRAALEDDVEFNIGAGSILYQWTSGSWTAQTNSGDALPRGRGFMLYFFDDPFETIDSGGIPLGVGTGSENQSADKTVSSLSTSEDFHLLGNPFDAAFDLSALNLAAQGFQTTVQVWDPSAGSYTQVTQSGDHSDVIGAWQGFFVERAPDASTGGTELTFSTSGKQSSGGSLIGSKSTRLLAGATRQNASFKGAEPRRATLELRLAITGEASDDDTAPPAPSGKNAAGGYALATPVRDTTSRSAAATAGASTETDTLENGRATVLFGEAATSGWDAYEASQLTPFSSGGYATLSSPLLRLSESGAGDSTLVRRALASEPLPTDTTAVRLPLSVHSVGTAGEATISWPEAERDGLPEGWTAELIDTATNERVDLRGEAYSFELEDGDGELKRPSDSRFQLAVGPASAIPVELDVFEARATGEETVRLSWQTASEQNNARFAVQRRIVKPSRRDGSTETVGPRWTTIGRVEAAGTTAEAQRYRFTDADLPYAAETLTYRLKQVDTDGSVHFSKEVVVEREGADELSLKAPFPNPVRQAATIQYALPDAQKVRMVVYDLLGRRVRTLANERQEAGRHQVRLDSRQLSGLASGTYLLRLQAGGAAKTRKVTVVQ